MFHIFDENSADGLGVGGLIGLIALCGVIGYFIWQAGYQHGSDDVLRLDAPGCVVRDAAGRGIPPADLKQRQHVVIPKGATVAAACVNAV